MNEDWILGLKLGRFGSPNVQKIKVVKVVLNSATFIFLHLFNPLTSLPKSADTAESQISFAGILS